MKTRVFSIIASFFFIFFSESAFAEAELSYKGGVSYEFWGFPLAPYSSNQVTNNNTIELNFESKLRVDDWFVLAFAPRYKKDFNVRERDRLLLDEAWLGFISEKTELRLGFQRFTWGMVESEKLVDVLNQRDYGDEFFDSDKFGELAARLKLSFIEGTDIELYYLTYFTQIKLPTKNNRYSFTNGAFDIYQSNAVYGSKHEEWMPQYAIRTISTIETVDIALSYFHGYFRFPALSNTYQPYYYVVDQAGLEFTWVPGQLIVKLEMAYRNFNGTDTTRVPSALVPNDYLAYVGGIEYTFNQAINDIDLTLFLEYLGDTDVGKTVTDFRLLQNDLFAGYRLTFNDINSRELLMGITIDMENPDEFIYQAEYSQRFKEDFTLEFAVNGVKARSGSRLETFNEDLRFKANVTYNFGGSF